MEKHTGGGEGGGWRNALLLCKSATDRLTERCSYRGDAHLKIHMCLFLKVTNGLGRQGRDKASFPIFSCIFIDLNFNCLYDIVICVV